MANNNTNYIVTIKQIIDPMTPGVQGITVTAPMPDTFAFDTASSYEAPYAQGFGGNGALAQLGKAVGLRLTTQAFTAQIWQGSSETGLGLTLEFHTETDPDADVRTPVLNLLKLATASIDSTGLLKSPGPQLDLDQLLPVIGGAFVGGAQAGLAAFNQASNKMFANAKQTSLTASGGSTQNGQSQSTTSNNNPGAPTSAAFWKSFLRNQVSIRVGNYAFFDSVVITDVQKTYSHQIDALTGLPLHAKVDIKFKPLFLLVQSDLDNIFALSQQ